MTVQYLQPITLTTATTMIDYDVAFDDDGGASDVDASTMTASDAKPAGKEVKPAINPAPAATAPLTVVFATTDAKKWSSCEKTRVYLTGSCAPAPALGCGTITAQPDVSPVDVIFSGNEP